MAAAADVLVLCGDLTDYGLAEEARVLVKELAAAKSAPIVAVLGNHDYESGEPDKVKAILGEAGVTVLDGEACEIDGVGFAGAKGLGGGFGEHALQPWGDGVLKQFVRESVDESLKLESALAKLRTARRVAVLHYSPIRETVEGEPYEIFPFLGSSRLEEPLLRYPVTVVLHGHAHHGRPEGHTRGQAPVYNVCLPLLLKAAPERPPFRLVDLDRIPG
jgi:Icc-related predicted phosphoesterase